MRMGKNFREWINGFHPSLVLLPFLLVGIVLLSWSSNERSIRSNSDTAMYEISIDNDVLGLTCECTLRYNCTYEGEALLGGVDFVQYFTDFKLADGGYNESETGKVGNSSIYSIIGNYKAYFLSEEHKELFDEAPHAYLPAWGGYCSWGISEEHCPDYPWNVDCLGPPGVWSYWTIIDERLYFFYNEEPKINFLANYTYNIAMGNARWEKWFPDNPIENMNTNCYHPKGSEGDSYAYLVAP